jgi:hypothetical protein
LLGACSDAPKPSPVKAESAPPTPTASASPTTRTSAPPKLPAAARGTGDKAAIAFVRYVIDVLNYSAETLDVTSLRAISSSGCTA